MLFSEVYSAYFNAVAAIISEALDGEISERRIDEITAEHAFSESMLSILPAIKNEDWLVMNKALRTPIRHKPTMPLTTLQKRWLKSLLLDPRIALFAPNMEGLTDAGLEDVEQLFYPSDFVYFDRYHDGDPFDDAGYIQHFRTIMTALREKRRVHIRQLNRKGQIMSGRHIPLKMEYSAKDDKFRLLALSRRSYTYINIARIEQCALLEEYEPGEVKLPRRRERSVIFQLTDERNALDRCMLHFSDFRKETRRTGDDTYEVLLWYEASDETEVLIRILQFGPMVRVTQPDGFVELIRERIFMQKGLLE